MGLEEAHFDKQMINLPPLGHNLRKNLSCAKVQMGKTTITLTFGL